MLIVPPPEFRKRRERPRRVRPGQPIHEGLRITRVAPLGPPKLLLVYFPQDVVWDGSEDQTAFKVMTSAGVMESSIGIATIYSGCIEIEFPNDVASGAAWELTGPLLGITPEVAWPQSGSVE